MGTFNPRYINNHNEKFGARIRCCEDGTILLSVYENDDDTKETFVKIPSRLLLVEALQYSIECSGSDEEPYWQSVYDKDREFSMSEIIYKDKNGIKQHTYNNVDNIRIASYGDGTHSLEMFIVGGARYYFPKVKIKQGTDYLVIQDVSFFGTNNL